MTASTTNKSKEEQLRKAIARICYSNGNTAGTGLLISNEYVLTCAHVVQSILKAGDTPDPLPNSADIQLELPFLNSRQFLKAEVILPTEIYKKLDNFPIEKDIALLRLIEKQDQYTSLSYIDFESVQSYSEGSPLRLQGFSEKNELSSMINVHLRSSIGRGIYDIVLDSRSDEPYTIKPGFSGAPVWVRNSTKIVGMIVARPSQADVDIPVAYFIPSNILLNLISKYVSISFPFPIDGFPKSIDLTYLEEFQTIVDSFKNGTIIPFLGSGITPDFYSVLERELTKYVGRSLHIDNQNSWDVLEANERQKRIKLISKLIGLPCSSCHYFIEHRGTESKNEDCPMLGGLLKSSITSEDPLYPIFIEQQLSVAIMNLRYLSQYCELVKGFTNFYIELEIILRKINCLDSFEVYKFFRELPGEMLKAKKPEKCHGKPYDLIVTTNYDLLLEEGLLLEHQNRLFAEIYTDNNVDHVKFQYKIGEKKPIEVKQDSAKLSVDIGIPSEERQPLILQLYGRLDNPCVISNDHFNSLLKKLIELPNEIKVAIQKRPLLFLGFSKNDYELQQIVKCLSAGTTLSKGWVVYQDVPNNENEHEQLGELSEKIWKMIAPNIKLLPIRTSSRDKISLKDFIQDLRTGLMQG